jgi:fermentation-respiration switch protein FrsA (DUF1100 family)
MSLENFWSLPAQLGIAYLGVVLFVYLTQSGLLYLPDVGGRDLARTPAEVGMDYQDVTLTTEDEVQLHGWFVPVERPRATVLFFHGNAGNISHRLGSLQIFHHLGLNVLIIDYRGYGKSEGSPSEQGTYRDAEAAWRHLVEQRGIPAGEIILFGRSLGAALAAHLAARERPLALVMESPFVSVPELGAKLYPWLPVRWLSRFDYDNRALLERVAAPLMIIHSREDEIIPFSHGRQLYEQAAEPKRLVELSGGHNTGMQQNLQRYLEAWDDFIRELR